MLFSDIKDINLEYSKHFFKSFEGLCVAKEDCNEEHPFYKPLEICHKVIYPRDGNSLKNEEHQKKWMTFMNFMSKSNYFFIQSFLKSMGKNLLSNPESLDRLIFLIQKFNVTPVDFYKNLTIRPASDYIDDLGTFIDFSLDELPLPQELSPYIKKNNTSIEFNENLFENIINLSFLFNQNTENKKMIELMRFLIHNNFFNFSIFTKKIFLSQVKKIEYVDLSGKFCFSYEETLKQVNLEAFKNWLDDWKEECGVTEKEDGSGFEIVKPLTEKQKAIQYLVSNGFSEEYTKKAFAQYAINQNQSIFVDGKAYLDSISIPNNLLVHFIRALPKESTTIVFDHVLEDDQFSEAIDALKAFPKLSKIVIKQQELSEIKKAKLRDIFNGQINPELKSIYYLLNEEKPNNSDYLKDLDFLMTLNIAISADIPDDLNNKDEKEAELFEYHQQLVNHEKLIFNTNWVELFIPSALNRVFNYLQCEPATSKITEISGDIYGLNKEQFKQLVSILRQLPKLEKLHLTYDDNCEDFTEKEQLIKETIQLSNVNFTWKKEENKVYIKPVPLPNETLETSLLCIEQELKEKGEEKSTRPDNHSSIHVDKENPCIHASINPIKKSLSTYSDKEHLAFKKQLLDSLEKKNTVLKTYMAHFFDTVIDSVLKERERFIEILKENLDPLLFSMDSDTSLVCQKIDALSGFLDYLHEELHQFIEKDPAELNDVSTNFLKKLTQLTNFNPDNKQTITLNSAYRDQKIGDKSPLLQDTELDFSIINKARHPICMLLKQLIRGFFESLPSIKMPWIVTKEKERESSIKNNLNHYPGIFTHSAEKISQSIQAMQEPTSFVKNY